MTIRMPRIPYLTRCSAIVALTLMLAGCETTSTTKETPQAKRITELGSVYEKAPAAAKAAASTGNLTRGQSPELVYIALGQPDVILASADGRITTWTYHNYLPPEPPRQSVAKKEKFRSNFNNQSGIADPLQDAVGAFQYNLSRQMVPSTDPDNLDFDKYKEQKRPDQSWADYARYRTNRDMAKTGGPAVVKMVDDKARAEYIELQQKERIPDLTTVKLEVIFLGPQVADAIVNDSVSAFALQNP